MQRKKDQDKFSSQNQKLLDTSKTKIKFKSDSKQDLISNYASSSIIIGGIYQNNITKEQLVDPNSFSLLLSLKSYTPLNSSIFIHPSYHSISLGNGLLWTFDDDPFTYYNELATQNPFCMKIDNPCSVHYRNHTLTPFIFHISHPLHPSFAPSIQIKSFCQAWSSKFEPNWLGPYIIIAVFGLGAYQLSTLEGEPLLDPINSLHLRKFYTQLQRALSKT